MRTALYYIRSRCNYSQSMVARELHVSRQMFSAWENGTKSIPNARKAELADMFGTEKEKLDETDEAVILAYCDQPMFSRICQGKQVFSFAPEYRHSRVFLGIPQESPPGEQCKDLMSRKNKIMERIECTLRFDPQQQAEQLQDMINAVDLLDQFGQLLYCVDRVEAEHRGRLLQFLLEQVEILSVLLGRESKKPQDEWQMQQLHLLRCRWSKYNQVAKRRQLLRESTPSEDILTLINQLYHDAKHSCWDRAELQWRLNQLLEMRHENELD